MEKKTRNKAEAPADFNKAEGGPDLSIERLKEEVSNLSDEDLQKAYATTQTAVGALNAEAAKRGVALGLGAAPAFKRDAAAGKFEGTFICRRPLSGDKDYRPGDERVGSIAELEHLVLSGALQPADDETAEAVKAFSDFDAPVYVAPVSASEVEGEGE